MTEQAHTSGSCARAWVKLTEVNYDGSLVTTDYEARATYVNVQPAPDAYSPVRTVHVIPDFLMVDLDADGMVRGIEILSVDLNIGHLLTVLRRCKWAGDAA